MNQMTGKTKVTWGDIEERERLKSMTGSSHFSTKSSLSLSAETLSFPRKFRTFFFLPSRKVFNKKRQLKIPYCNKKNPVINHCVNDHFSYCHGGDLKLIR